MDKRTLIEILSDRLNQDKEKVSGMIDAMRDCIAESGRNLDSVAFPAFGSFESKKRNERIALHPATGKRLLIPPKIVISFKSSNILKQKVNK